MSYSLELTENGASKIAAAIVGGPKVNFKEMIFSSSLPVYASELGPGSPTTIFVANYSAGSFIPGFRGWAIQITGPEDIGQYDNWISGFHNGVYLEAGGEDSLGLEGYFPATYSAEYAALLVPSDQPNIADGGVVSTGMISGATVHIDPTIVNEVARETITSVTPEENVVTLQALLDGASGGFYIRSVYVSDLDSFIIAAARFPETYKPAGFEGGASVLTVNAKINLASVEEGVTVISEDAEGSVRYDIPMTLDAGEQAQACENIGLDHTRDAAKPVSTPQASKLQSAAFVIRGDSLSISYVGNAAGQNNDWPTKLRSKSNWKESAQFVNLAVAGKRLDEMDAMFASVDARIPSPVAGRNVYCLLGGTNDIGAGRTAAQIQSSLTSLWGKARAAGYKVLSLTIPGGSGNATRDTVNAWILTQSAAWDWCVNIADLSSTVDGTHLTAAANQTIADRIDTALGNYFGTRYQPGADIRGQQRIVRLNRYEPALDLRTDAAATESDGFGHAASPLKLHGAPVKAVHAPSGRGLSFSPASALHIAPDSAISLSGDFTIIFLARPSSRLYSNAGNYTTVAANKTTSYGMHLFPNVGADAGTPYLYQTGVTYKPTLNNQPLEEGEYHCFSVVRDSTWLANKVTSGVDGVPTDDKIVTGSISIDAFLASPSSWFSGDVYGLAFFTGPLRWYEIEEIAHGACPTGFANCAAYYDFSDGYGYRLHDRSANSNHAWISPSANTKWLCAQSKGEFRAACASGSYPKRLGYEGTSACLPSNAAVMDIWVVSDKATNISVGSTSGGTDIVASTALTANIPKKLTVTPAIAQNIYIGSSDTTSAINLRIIAETW